MSRPLRFVAVGAAGYGVNIAAFAALHAARTPYVAGTVLAYVASNTLMYLPVPPNPLSWSAVADRRLRRRLAQPLSLLAATPAAFALSKRWVFR